MKIFFDLNYKFIIGYQSWFSKFLNKFIKIIIKFKETNEHSKLMMNSEQKDKLKLINFTSPFILGKKDLY